MKQAIALGAFAALGAEASNIAKLHKLESQGVDVEKLMVKQDHWITKAYQSIHKATLKSNRLQGNHATLKAARLGAEAEDFDEASAETEEALKNLICDENGENCYKIDWVLFSFDVTKGLFVGVTAVYSEGCRSGLVGVVDSAIAMYNHIEIYLPQNTNKFAMAFNEFTEAGNIVFASCDMSHLYSELTKLADYQNWEQYIAIAARIGGVFINEFGVQQAVIQEASAAGDGYATGVAVGELVSSMLDSIL